MRTAFECFQKAARLQQRAEDALTRQDRDFLLDAAEYWKQRGREAVKDEGNVPPPALVA